MLELLQQIVATLQGDATLTAIIPAANISVGRVDIVTEAQSTLGMPRINIHVVSEVSRSVPSKTRDSLIQIDIWSRNTMLEVINAYERIVTLLNYFSGNQSSAHIFWERLGGAVDMFESDRGIWHRAMTYNAWTQK